MKKILSFLVVGLALLVGAQYAGARIYNPPAAGLSSLTPWTENVSAGGFSLSNLLNLTATGTSTLATTTATHLVAGNPAGSTISNSDASIDVFGTTNAIIHAHNVGAQSPTAGAAYISYAAPTGASLLSGNRLGAYVFGGSNAVSNTLANSSAVTSFATENWSGTQNGSNMKFEVTPNGATSRVAAMTIDQNGYTGIGTTTPRTLLALDRYGVASSTISVYEYRYGLGSNIATSTATTIDARTANQIKFPIGLDATTLTLSEMAPGQSLNVIVENPNGTAGALTWAATAGYTLLWAGGTAPTQTTTANKQEMWIFRATQASSSVAILGSKSSAF